MKTYSTVTHHRVYFVQGLATFLDFLYGYAELFGQFCFLLISSRNELVERRVEQTEYYRLAVHNLESALYRSLDKWFKLCKCFLSFFICIAENHLAEFCKRSL